MKAACGAGDEDAPAPDERQAHRRSRSKSCRTKCRRRCRRCSVGDRRSGEASRRSICWRAATIRTRATRVGMRPLGVLLPDGAPELPPDTPNAARGAGQVDRRSRESADRARDGEPHLAVSFRHAASSPRPTISAAWASGPRIRSCSIIWPTNSCRSGFSVKHIHRLILLSNTYRQSSDRGERRGASEKDPDNRLLWRFNRRRLEAEEIRDAMLAVSGSLNAKAGGPSVIVPIDKDLVDALYKPSQWAVTQGPGRAQPPQRLPDRQAQPAAAVHGGLRRAGCAGELPAPRIEHARAAGAGAAERRSSPTSRPKRWPQRLETEAGRILRKQVDLAYRLVAGPRRRRRKRCSWRWQFLEDATAGGSSRWRCST